MYITENKQFRINAGGNYYFLGTVNYGNRQENRGGSRFWKNKFAYIAPQARKKCKICEGSTHLRESCSKTLLLTMVYKNEGCENICRNKNHKGVPLRCFFGKTKRLDIGNGGELFFRQNDNSRNPLFSVNYVGSTRYVNYVGSTSEIANVKHTIAE